MKKLITSFLLSFSLVGCVSSHQITFEHPQSAISIFSHISDVDTGKTKKAYASAVRWNNDYILSVKHLEGSRERCSSDSLDVAFFKSPIKESIPSENWAALKTGDEIQMEGFSHLGKNFHKIFGVVKPGMFTLGGVAKYKLTTGVVKQGMSGGPVKNSNGDLVGIIVGYTAEPVQLMRPTKEDLENPNQTYSVILPYSSIEEAWKEVQEKIKNGQC